MSVVYVAAYFAVVFRGTDRFGMIFIGLSVLIENVVGEHEASEKMVDDGVGGGSPVAGDCYVEFVDG